MIRQQQRQAPESPTKGITEQEINQCMEFCAMYNILYAMHTFPMPLKNVDERKKVKTSKLEKTTVQGKIMTQGKKTSKFQKLRAAKKQHKPQLGAQTHYEASQVENYVYQTQEMQQNQSQFQKGKSQMAIIKAKVQDSPETLEKEVDLAALISGLAVGSKSHRNEDNNYSLFRKNNRDEQIDYKQSRLYQQEHPSTVRDSPYQKYDSQNSAISYYANEDQAYYKGNQSQHQLNSNQYSKAGYESLYDLNSFMANPMQKYPSQTTFMQSPYAAQLRTFSNINPYDPSSNINRSLFNQSLNQSFNPQFNQQFDPFNYEHKSQLQSQNLPKNNKYISNLTSQHHQPYESKIYQTPTMSSHIKSAKRQQDDEMTNVSSFIIPNRNQSQYPVQNTPPKTLNPSSTQRSLSPLGSSASCRNFFAQTPKQVSADRSGVSRSKSKTKEKPGGSKSFYQPSLSGRKVITKQREEERDESTYSRPGEYSEQDLHVYNRPHEFTGYNREEEQEVKSVKKKPIAPTQCPRNTRETDFSGVSGWQQGNQPQKSTKSQQIINSKTLQGTTTSSKRNPVQVRQQEKESPRLGYEKRNNSYDSDEEYQQENDVGLDDLEEDMERLNASRRKAPKPITEIDLTDTQNPKIRQKR